MLGQPAWHLGDMQWKPLNELDAALVALLALDGPCHRDTLAGRLWPSASRRGAPNNLRQRVSRLLRQMGAPLFVTGNVYRLLDSVRLDVGPNAELPGDDLEFLAGCEYGHSDWLQDWVAARRQALRAARAVQLVREAEALERSNELADAVTHALRATVLAPLQESAWRQVMRLHYLMGDHTSAVDAFEAFEALLRDQTGARPGPETLHLLSTIEQSGRHELPRRRLPTSLQRPPQRIGRQAIWRAMCEAWDAGRAFLVSGEAGLGKSRLLGDFAAGRSGIVSERARPGDALSANSLLTRLLRGVIHQAGAQPQDAVRRELSRLLPELGPVPSAAGDEHRLRAAVESLLVHAQKADNPLAALVLDDLQFADMATLETLRWLNAGKLFSQPGGLRLGLATRPPADGALCSLFDSWLCDSQRPVRLELQPLSADEVEELLTTLQLPGFTELGLGARLVAHTGGHPLFVLETLKEAWLHEDAPAGGQALPRPASVRVLIEGRLRDLPPAATDLLRVAAIAGEEFNATRASALLGKSPLALLPAWRALEDAQILQGEKFAHDLMHDCAAALTPSGLVPALHAALAALLEDDPEVPPARIADHWQAAQRQAEAGRWWQRAAAAARLAGRLQDQQNLLERAAGCHRQTGAQEAEFDCVRDSLHSGMLRHGAQSLLAALPRLQALVRSPRQQLDLLLLHAEAMQSLERHVEALALARQAERLARDVGVREAGALGLQGVALAHLGQGEQALTIAERAVALAVDPNECLGALRTQAYALYALSRLGAALPVQRQVLQLAAELGDETEAITAEVSLAALLTSVGDNAGSLAHASAAAQRAQALGLADDSILKEVNQITLGMAAAALGRFDLAVTALEDAVRLAGPDSAPSAQSKARTALARVRLWLGDEAAARSLVNSLPPSTAVGQRMQAALILAQADQMAGRSGDDAWARLARLGAEHADLPPMLSAWMEWSYQGPAEPALARLRSEAAHLLVLDLPGAAHALQLRELDRLLESAATDAGRRAQVAVLAGHLQAPVAAGQLHAKVYPVEAWWVLHRAFTLLNDGESAARCREQAQRWLNAVQMPNEDASTRQRFLDNNPYNKALRALAS